MTACTGHTLKTTPQFSKNNLRYHLDKQWYSNKISRWFLCSVVPNMLDCDIVAGKVEIQSHHNVHFQTYTIGKVMVPYHIYQPLRSGSIWNKVNF